MNPFCFEHSNVPVSAPLRTKGHLHDFLYLLTSVRVDKHSLSWTNIRSVM